MPNRAPGFSRYAFRTFLLAALLAQVAAVAAQSAEWRLCAQGRGINCHRFARQVVFALSRSDPEFKMIVGARPSRSLAAS